MEATVAFNSIYLPTHQGHGNARRLSMENSHNELVALMDADDISLPQRFEKQLEKFASSPELSIVGGQITEFVGNPDNIISVRVVPEGDEDIKTYIKKRCPMNQVSVMFKKSAYDAVGGYIDWYCEEDYYLWLRMALGDCRFANVPDTLVNVRVGGAMSTRRGGWKYFSSETKLQSYMLKNNVISLPRYLYNVAVRFAGEVIATDSIRNRLFKLIRNEYKEESLKPEKSDTKPEGYPPFSVAMCVYGKDNPEWFNTALASVVNQTVKPNEIVLVVDGPIPDEIQHVIDNYRMICSGD